MSPADVALRQPRAVLLAALLCVGYGALTWLDLPRQENPTLPDRFASVTVYLPGADPEKVERLVTREIEAKIGEIEDVRDIFSVSAEGRSHTVVEIEKGSAYAERLAQVRDKVQQARLAFPPGASEPEVDTETLSTYTLIFALVGADAPPVALRREARELEREIELLPGVRLVDLVGEPREEIEVAVDLRALSQRGLPLARVQTALAERNVLLPGGSLDLGPARPTVQTSGAFTRVDEIGATWLGTGASDIPVRLADVSRVERRIAEPQALVRRAGAPAVGLAVEMLPGRNAIAFGERLRAFAAEREKRLPDGMAIEVVADESSQVARRLERLENGLLLGLLAVVGVTLLGLGWRSGLVVSCSIPLALAASIALLDVFDLALHQISIAGLLIAVGLVVDESIIVTDSIQRQIERGASPAEAAVRGLGEIHLAVLAGAATTLVAFLPLALMEGDIGDFLRSIPIVASLMIAASVAVAHFVTPLLAAVAHGARRGSDAPPRLRALEYAYRSLLGHLVGRARLVLAAFGAVLALSLAALLAALWPPSFFPDADRGQFLIDVTLPDGAPLRETDAAMARIGERLDAEPLVRDWTAFVGSAAPKFYYNEFSAGRAPNLGAFVVNTREDLPQAQTSELVARLDRELPARAAGARVRARALVQGYAASSDVRVFVLGPSLAVLRELSGRIRAIAEDLPGVARVRESFGYDPLALEARLDPGRASLLGITPRDVAELFRTAIDGVRATTFREDDEEIDVVVRIDGAQRRSVADLASLAIESPVAGRAVPLAQVASIEPRFNVREILRFNRKREASIEADVEGAPVVTVTDALERAVRERVSLPSGYEIVFRGERQEVNESFLSLARAALLAVFLIYIILVLRFRSFGQPALIVLAIPMALAGSCVGLVATGNPLGLTSFLGAIALSGVVVNDSIVLLDAMNRLRSRGEELEDAVLTGAVLRLRPVLLTTATTIGGLLPLSVSGDAFWAPFGYAVIFGLGASTLLTLAVQPAAYLALERRLRRRRETRRVRSGWTLAPAK